MAKTIWTPETLNMETAINLDDDLYTARKLFRYWWAWCVLKRGQADLVYDLNCESGYGCRVMHEQQPHEPKIVGFYEDQETIEIARGAYAVPKKVEFKRLNLELEWATVFHNTRPGLITLFDVLPSLPHRELVLMSLADLLHNDGTLLLSLDRSESDYSRRLKGHGVVYGRQDLNFLLSRFFNKVLWYPDGLPSADYITQVNEQIDKAHGSGYLHMFGQDLIACSEPIRSRGK